MGATTTLDVHLGYEYGQLRVSVVGKQKSKVGYIWILTASHDVAILAPASMRRFEPKRLQICASDNEM